MYHQVPPHEIWKVCILGGLYQATKGLLSSLNFHTFRTEVGIEISCDYKVKGAKEPLQSVIVKVRGQHLIAALHH